MDEVLGGHELAVSPDDVVALLRATHGLVPGRVEIVDGELATICKVEAGGQLLAAKVHRRGRDEPSLRWRTHVLDQVSHHQVPVPRVVPAEDGQLVAGGQVAGVPVLVVVETWLAGTPLHAVRAHEALLGCVGRTARRLAGALAHCPDPPQEDAHAWEASRGRDTLLRALPEVTDHRVRQVALQAADLFQAEVTPRLEGLPRAVVHQDLHDANLIVQGGAADEGADPARVAVIDFGDALRGLRVAELAVAAGYGARCVPDPLAGLLAVVDGWGPDPLVTEDEVAVLLPLAITRLAVNAAVWAARAQGPRAAYARARSVRSLPALEALLGAYRGGVDDRIAARLVPAR